MAKKKGLSKRTIYTIFIGKFIFSLALIFWTITMVLDAGVGLDDDNTFMSTYHQVDDNYNKIAAQNNIFNKKYSIKLIINQKDIGKVSYDDIYMSQRVIKHRKDKKNILKIDENIVKIIIIDKKTKKSIKDIDAKITFTMPSTHKYDTTIQIQNSNQEVKFNIAKKSYWNIMGEVKIKDDQGYFFIKTNAK